MKKQSLFTGAISILSLIILVILILVSRQETFSFYPSHNLSKKENSPLMTRGLNFMPSQQVNAQEDFLVFPLNDEDMSLLFNTSKVMYINADSLFLRSGPSTSFDIVETLFMHDEVKVGATITHTQFDYGEDPVEWVAVNVGEMYGFVNPNYLSESTDILDGHDTSLEDETEEVVQNVTDKSETSQSQSNSNSSNTTSSNSSNSSNSTNSNNTNKPSNNTTTTKPAPEKNETPTNDSTNEEQVTPPSKPKITTKNRTETEIIPHKVIELKKPDLEEGQVKVFTPGEDGIRTITYKDTFEDGKRIKTEKTGTKVTKQPTDEVRHIGTKPVDEEASDNSSE